MKTPKKTNTTKISLGRVLPRLDSTSDAPMKLIFLVLYILGAVLIWNTQADIAASTEQIEYISPIAEFAARNIFVTYLIIAGIAVTILILTPIGKRSVQDQLKSIGLVNHSEVVPELKSKRKDKKNPRISIWEFTSQGIPLKVWKDKQAAIETALDITIVKIKNGSGKSRVLIQAVPAVSDIALFTVIGCGACVFFFMKTLTVYKEAKKAGYAPQERPLLALILAIAETAVASLASVILLIVTLCKIAF